MNHNNNNPPFSDPFGNRAITFPQFAVGCPLNEKLKEKILTVPYGLLNIVHNPCETRPRRALTASTNGQTMTENKICAKKTPRPGKITHIGAQGMKAKGRPVLILKK